MVRQNQIFSRGYSGLDDIIGVEWDSSQSSPTLKRIDEDYEELPSDYRWSKYFDNHPIWGQMRRCTLTDAGVPTFGTNARGDGLTLTDDYTMVRVPRVYHKFSNSGTLWRWLVCPEPSGGFDLQPTYNQRGHSESPANQIYVGAYTAGANGGTTAANGVTNTLTASNWSGLKLTSKSGVKNLTSGTMTQMETAGNLIGTGFGLMNFHTLTLLQLLFYIEYASFNSQSVLGMGRTKGTNTAAAITGTNLDQVGEGAGTDIQSLLAANGTYGSADDYKSVVWRGIENLWGNLYQFIPGYNTTDTEHRILKRDGSGTIAATMAAGSYEAITSPIPLNGVDNISGIDSGAYCQGHISGLALDASSIMGSMFVPGALVGASNTYLTEYCTSHQSGISQIDILLAGDYWNGSAKAGIGCRYSAGGPLHSSAGIGGRIEAIL